MSRAPDAPHRLQAHHQKRRAGHLQDRPFEALGIRVALQSNQLSAAGLILIGRSDPVFVEQALDPLKFPQVVVDQCEPFTAGMGSDVQVVHANRFAPSLQDGSDQPCDLELFCGDAAQSDRHQHHG
jgi:hypothetical protein